MNDEKQGVILAPAPHGGFSYVLGRTGQSGDIYLGLDDSGDGPVEVEALDGNERDRFTHHESLAEALHWLARKFDEAR